MTTPAAAPAAPAAAPVAPAQAPVPAQAPAAAPPAAPAAPVAPAAPAAPAAAPAAPAPAPAASGEDSLIPAEPAPAPVVPQTEAERIAAARAVVKAADEAADPNGGKAWLLNDTIMGEGEKPSWFKSDKYKTVTAQAEAYAHLEPRFGAFVGAPKDGRYEYKPPEGFTVNMDAPLMQGFTKWAAEKQLSQEGYADMMGMLLQYEATQQPNMATIKTALGKDADARIDAVAKWGKANLDDAGYASLRTATSGVNAASVFKTLEAFIAKTGTVRMPKPGADVPGAQSAGGLEAIKAKQAYVDPKTGKRPYATDSKYRDGVEKEYRDYYASQGQ